MQDPSERQIVETEIRKRLDANQPLETDQTTIALLADILDNSSVIQIAGQTEYPATHLLWRLGAACNMGHRVLLNVGRIECQDPGFLPALDYQCNTQIVARDLLRANPGLLRDQDYARAFWLLVGYDPRTYRAAEPQALIDALWALQEADPLPSVVIGQMRHCRDTFLIPGNARDAMARSFGENAVGMQPPSDRELELKEATNRMLLSAFVAYHTKDDADRGMAAAMATDFVNRIQSDAAGCMSAVALVTRLEDSRIARTEEGKNWINVLGQKIIEVIPNIGTLDLEERSLAIFAEQFYGFASKRQGTVTEAMVRHLGEGLEDCIRLLDMEDAGSLGGPQSAQARSLRRITVKKALGLLYPETSAPTVQDIAGELRTNGFSGASLASAFALVSAELNSARQTEVLDELDGAMGLALSRLSPVFAEFNENLDMLARFPSGKRFIARCVQVFAQSLNSSEVLEDYTLTGKALDQGVKVLYDTLRSCRLHPHELDGQIINDIESVLPFLMGLFTLMEEGEQKRALNQRIDALLSLAMAAKLNRIFQPVPAAEIPVNRLLQFYKQFGEAAQ